MINKHIFFLVSLLLIFFVKADAQLNYWVPNEPPEAHYTIDARIDLQSRTISGTETITFSNGTGKDIEEIAIDWRISPASSIRVTYGGEPLQLLNASEQGVTISPLFYSLPKPLKPGESIKLSAELSSKNLEGSEPEEIKLTNWYPRLWWDGMPLFDSFSVKLDTPPGYAVAAGGRLHENTGYYENDGVRTFGIYLGKGLKTESREADGVLITSLFTEKGSECALLCLETAADVVKFYKQWLGFFPFRFLYIIPGAARPMGGYPFASGIVVIHGQEQFEQRDLLHWKWITAHEIGHQYWGEYVMDDDEIPWLWIGMGIYTDKQYVLSRNLSLKRHTNMFKRYLHGVRQGYNTTVDIPLEQKSEIKYDHNNIVVHGKGFSIISALESVLGEDTFQRIYTKCLKDYGGKRLGYKEFWRVCEEETGENLDWFFNQWVRSNKYLSCEVISRKSEKKGDIYKTEVEIAFTGTLKMPVPVKAVFEDGSCEMKTMNRFMTLNKLAFESSSPLKEIVIDPENKLALFMGDIKEPEKEEKIKEIEVEVPDEVTKQGLNKIISELPYSGVGKSIVTVYKKALSLNVDIARHWFKLGMVLFDGGHYEESFKAFEKVTTLNPDRLIHFTVLVWMGQLKDLLGDRESAIKYYKESLKYDTGETMRHDQYGMRINTGYVQERLKIPFKWER